MSRRRRRAHTKDLEKMKTIVDLLDSGLDVSASKIVDFDQSFRIAMTLIGSRANDMAERFFEEDVKLNKSEALGVSDVLRRVKEFQQKYEKKLSELANWQLSTALGFLSTVVGFSKLSNNDDTTTTTTTTTTN